MEFSVFKPEESELDPLLPQLLVHHGEIGLGSCGDGLHLARKESGLEFVVAEVVGQGPTESGHLRATQVDAHRAVGQIGRASCRERVYGRV